MGGCSAELRPVRTVLMPSGHLPCRLAMPYSSSALDSADDPSTDSASV